MQEVGVLRDDPVERVLPVAHLVHLVHQDGDLPDAEHCQHVAVSAGIFLHAFRGVDHQKGGRRVRRAADHVLQELDVARCIDDEEVPFRRLEEDSRGVDRDALRLLVLQGVEQERILERLRVALAVSLDLLELALRQRAGVGKQTADDRALAVIDMAGDHEAQPLAVRGRRHMYPLRRRSSSVPRSSASCARPDRSAMSLNLPVRSSATSSAGVFAVDSTGKVQGWQPSER